MENRIDNLLPDVCQKAKKMMGDNLIEIILYGSYARGDFDDDSDVDIALIVDEPRDKLAGYRQGLAMLVSDYCLNDDVLFSFSCIPKSDFESYKSASQYYRNIDAEGIRLNA